MGIPERGEKKKGKDERQWAVEKRSLGQRPDLEPAHSQLMSSAPQPLRICSELSRRPVVKNVPGLSGGRGSSVDSLLPAFRTFLGGEAREIDEERKKS